VRYPTSTEILSNWALNRQTKIEKAFSLSLSNLNPSLSIFFLAISFDQFRSFFGLLTFSPW
jgi:hypothetical protein